MIMRVGYTSIFHALLIVCMSTWESVATSDNLREDVRQALGGRKLRVVTIEMAPYTTYSHETSSFVGYIPDLLDLLSNRLGFQYEFYKSPDGRFGSQSADGGWNGMIGEIKKWEKTNGSEGADMTAAPLTMTRLREAHIDFIKPFQQVGLTLLTRKATPGQTDRHFSVMTPLSPAVWATLAVATIVMALTLWGIYKLAGIAGPVEDQQKFGLAGCLWFVYTSLQWQGFNRTPRPVGARILTCAWFVFVTMMLVTYIGGMVYHFDWATRGYFRSLSPLGVQNVEDVVNEKAWSYGAIAGGSTERFIKTADQNVYKTMSAYWATPEGAKKMVKSEEEGVGMIKNTSRYAFIMETMMAKHRMNQDCDLTTVGDPFGLRSYGLAVPTDHPMEEPLHKAVLELMETGDLEALEEEWWTGDGKCWEAEAAPMYSGLVPVKQADIEMMAVPFALIGAGVIAALLLTGLDILLVKYRGTGLTGDVFAMKSSVDDHNGM